MELALWRDIALVWLAFLCLIGLIVPLAVSLFAVKGMHALVDRTPRLLRQVQGYSRTLRTQTDKASYRVAEPVVKAQAVSARAATFLDRLLRRPASMLRGEEKK